MVHFLSFFATDLKLFGHMRGHSHRKQIRVCPRCIFTLGERSTSRRSDITMIIDILQGHLVSSGLKGHTFAKER